MVAFPPTASAVVIIVTTAAPSVVVIIIIATANSPPLRDLCLIVMCIAVIHCPSSVVHLPFCHLSSLSNCHPQELRLIVTLF